jgi:archaemetzincin
VKLPPLPPRIVLVALGPMARSLLAEVGGALTAVYGPPAIAGPSQQRPDYAFNRDRQQYHSTAILRRLAQVRNAAEDVPILGLTAVDLFVPEAPFVFGEADREAGAAVLSLSRLSHGAEGKPADPEQLLRRARIEGLRQVGHLLGLSQCPDPHCAMSLSHRPSDLDRKTVGLCAACRATVRPGVT